MVYKVVYRLGREMASNKLTTVKVESLVETGSYPDGNGLYFEVVANYIGNYIESKTQEMIAMGRRNAEKYAGEELSNFHQKYGIANQVDSLEDTLSEIADEIRTLVPSAIIWNAAGFTGNKLNTYPSSFTDLLRRNIVVDDNKQAYLKKPQTVISDFINSTASFSSRGSLGYKASNIADLLGDFRSRSVKVEGKWKTVKCTDLQITNGEDVRDIQSDEQYIPF